MSPHIMIICLDNAEEYSDVKIMTVMESVLQQTKSPAAVAFCTTAPVPEGFLPFQPKFPVVFVTIDDHTLELGAVEAAFYELEKKIDVVELARGHVSIMRFPPNISQEFCEAVHEELEKENTDSWPVTLVYKRFAKDEDHVAMDSGTLHTRVFPVSIVRTFLESYSFRAHRATKNPFWASSLVTFTAPPLAPWKATRQVSWTRGANILLPSPGNKVAYIEHIEDAPDGKKNVRIGKGVLTHYPRSEPNVEQVALVSVKRGEIEESLSIAVEELELIPEETSPVLLRLYGKRADLYLKKNPSCEATTTILKVVMGIVSGVVHLCMSNAIHSEQHELFMSKLSLHLCEHLPDTLTEDDEVLQGIVNAEQLSGWAGVCSLLSIPTPFSHELLDDTSAPLFPVPTMSPILDPKHKTLSMEFFAKYIVTSILPTLKGTIRKDVNVFGLRYARACCAALRYAVPATPGPASE